MKHERVDRKAPENHVCPFGDLIFVASGGGLMHTRRGRVCLRSTSVQTDAVSSSVKVVRASMAVLWLLQASSCCRSCFKAFAVKIAGHRVVPLVDQDLPALLLLSPRLLHGDAAPGPPGSQGGESGYDFGGVLGQQEERRRLLDVMMRERAGRNLIVE